MARRKKKSGVDPQNLVRLGAGGGIAVAVVLVLYVASYFVFTTKHEHATEFTTYRTRVFSGELQRSIYRPILAIERRVYLDFEVVVKQPDKPAGNAASTR